MTTEGVAISLPWDAFLQREAERQGVPPERRELFLRDLRRHVDAFRQVEWPNILRSLGRDFRWEVPDGLEPHWVAPGKAIYWHRTTVRRVEEIVKDGHPTRRMVEVELGWQPTAPLPANNSSQIDHYTRKGFRLRPPSEGVEAALKSAALSVEAQPEPEVRTNRFFCDRHHQGIFGFRTWAQYLQHCAHYREPPLETPPAEELERAKGYPYYCFVHGLGFMNEQLAEQHRRIEERRLGKVGHPSVDKMRTLETTKDRR